MRTTVTDVSAPAPVLVTAVRQDPSMSLVQIEFYGDPCRSCGYEWATPDAALLAELRSLAAMYRAILGDLPGTARDPELGWCASAYVLHVADNLRMHAERMAGAALGGSYLFEGADQDEQATVRGYERIPIEGALWSLASVVPPYLDAFEMAHAAGVILPHAHRGDQLATQVLHGNVHDAHHHGWDLGRIARANAT
jgi:hypothetical protein